VERKPATDGLGRQRLRGDTLGCAFDDDLPDARAIAEEQEGDVGEVPLVMHPPGEVDALADVFGELIRQDSSHRVSHLRIDRFPGRAGGRVVPRCHRTSPPTRSDLVASLRLRFVTPSLPLGETVATRANPPPPNSQQLGHLERGSRRASTWKPREPTFSSSTGNF